MCCSEGRLCNLAAVITAVTSHYIVLKVCYTHGFTSFIFIRNKIQVCGLTNNAYYVDILLNVHLKHFRESFALWEQKLPPTVHFYITIHYVYCAYNYVFENTLHNEVIINT